MNRKMVFVVGTGRSGTHWLGHTLDEHPDVVATVEKPAIFDRVTRAALDPRTRRRNLRHLRWRYAWEFRRAAPCHYVDKSHPNLWHVEFLAEAFPQAVFLGIRRNVYATVASMLEHEGVLAWQANWERYPVPNRFLGITAEIARSYASLPSAAQCALRWRAHSERLDQVEADFGDRVLVVDYEDMADDYAGTATRIWDFVGLSPVPLTLEVRTASIDRWRDELTDDDIRAIDEILALP